MIWKYLISLVSFALAWYLIHRAHKQGKLTLISVLKSAICLIIGIFLGVSCSLNTSTPDTVQNHLTENTWVSDNGATIDFSPSGEAHISNPSNGTDVVGTYEVYILRKLLGEKIIVDVKLLPDIRYAEYVLSENTLTSENGFSYTVVGDA